MYIKKREPHFWSKEELNKFLRTGTNLKITRTLQSGQKSTRKYQISWSGYFNNCFLFWIGEDGKQDPLKNLNTDKVLEFARDPKREVILELDAE